MHGSPMQKKRVLFWSSSFVYVFVFFLLGFVLSCFGFFGFGFLGELSYLC